MRPLLAGLLLVLLVAITYQAVPSLGMLGWDGWPLVAASKVRTLGELVGTFGEELMDGRYPHGSFYRPVTHLSFALDEWASGLDPAGYHRTDLALLAGCALCLAALVTRLANGWAGLVAGVLFALHPVQLEVVVVPARRADLLALLCGLGCLLAQHDPPRHGRRALAFVLALAAAGSKETGVWIAPAVVAWQLLRPGVGPIAALRASAPALLGVAVYLVARTLVLGGLGGHTGVLGPAVSTGELWSGLLAGVLYPEPVIGPLGTGALVGFLVALGVAAALVAKQERRALLFAAAMALSLLALTSLADRLHAWYAALFAAPLAAVLGVTVTRSVHLLRADARLRGALALTPCLLVALSFLAGSPLVASYPRLDASNRWMEQGYAALERELADARPGQVVRVNPWPILVPPLPDGRGVQSLLLASAYTAQAYLELHHPEVTTAVQMFDGRRPATPRAGTVVVELVPGAPPSWVEEPRERP